jgi:hypothetical protein
MKRLAGGEDEQPSICADSAGRHPLRATAAALRRRSAKASTQPPVGEFRAQATPDPSRRSKALSPHLPHGRSHRQRELGRRLRSRWRRPRRQGPRFRSTSSAVRRLLMTATTRRLPPQGHCQTSASKVLRCQEAQSSRGRLGLSVSRRHPAPLPGKGASATPSFFRALTTRARSFAFGANTP